MKPIERIVRSDRWDAATRKAFYDHLAKNMTDTARLSYCDRKANFMSRSGTKRKLRQADDLLTWALEEFQAASSETRSYARATRSMIREELGMFENAASDILAAGRDNPNSAATAIYAARALLRAHSLRATRAVAELERRVMRDPTANSLQEYSVWKWIIGAACAKSRRDLKLAASRARRALKALGRVPEFQSWVERRTSLRFAPVDITRSELDAVRRWAASVTTE